MVIKAAMIVTVQFSLWLGGNFLFFFADEVGRFQHFSDPSENGRKCLSAE